MIASPINQRTIFLTSAELHLFRKRMVARPHKPDTRVAIHLLGSRGRILWTHRHYWLPHRQTGWIVLNITKTIRSMLLHRRHRYRQRRMQIGITFEKVNALDRTVHEVSIKKFMGRGAVGKPFMVLFLNDSSSVGTLQALTKSIEAPHSARRRVPSVDLFTQNLDDSVYDLNDFPAVQILKRLKRNAPSISNNRTTADPIIMSTLKYKNSNNSQQNKQIVISKLLQSKINRRKIRHRQKKLRRREEKRKSRLRNQNGLNISKTRRQLYQPESNWWYKPNSKSAKNSCRLAPLRIDFGDMGWDEWIITPKHYQGNMCIGSCSMQNMDRSVYRRMTNYAFIQNILQSLRLPQTRVPTLTCVPVRTEPLTLLYYDKNRNVILKTFLDMSVKECGCR